jgi:hypothetical protein
VFYHNIKISPTEGPRSERASHSSRLTTIDNARQHFAEFEVYDDAGSRASLYFHWPGDALSAGWAGGGKEILSIVVASPLMMVV